MDECLLELVSAQLAREDYRSQKSLSFRHRQQALCKARAANGFKVAKNKNR